MDEGEVVVRGEDGGVEEDEPDVDAEGGLGASVSRCNRPVEGIGGRVMGTHHAVAIALDALVQDLVPRRLQRAGDVSVGRPVPDQRLHRQVRMRGGRLLEAAAPRGAVAPAHGRIAVGALARPLRRCPPCSGAGIALRRRRVPRCRVRGVQLDLL